MAKRRALAIFHNWNNVTGLIPAGSSYLWEIEACIEDAVECGAQAACGVFENLEGEPEDIFNAHRLNLEPEAKT